MRNNGKKLSLHRLEALSDGIFAIAMTIMVLNLNVPRDAGINGASDLVKLLLSMWPVFMDYAISFMLLASMWIESNEHLDHLRHTDKRYLTFNMIRLMLITLIPFSTSLMTDYSGLITAEMFFHFNYFFIKVLTVANWKYIKKHEQLMHPDMKNLRDVDDSIRLNSMMACLPLIAVAITLFAPDWSNLVYLLVPFMFASKRKRKRESITIIDEK